VAAAPVAADTGMTSPGPPGSDAVAHPAAPNARHETGAGTISSWARGIDRFTGQPGVDAGVAALFRASTSAPASPDRRHHFPGNAVKPFGPLGRRGEMGWWVTYLRKADLDGESALLSLGGHVGLCVVSGWVVRRRGRARFRL